MSERPKRETWQDWIPPVRQDPRPLLTRAQVVERLSAEGVQVAAADLRYWEYEGILPRAVRQRHEGATRAVYPTWFPDLVHHLRTLQSGGHELREIAQILRAVANSRMPLWITLHPDFWRQAADAGGAVPPPDLAAPLMELARRTRNVHGRRAVRRGEVRFSGDDDSAPIIYRFAIDLDDDPEDKVSES